jgi:lipoprotein-anchoring transpeptidase ErfK/SrfK
MSVTKRSRVLAISLVGLVLTGTLIAVRASGDGGVESSALAQSVATIPPPTTDPPTTTTTVDPATLGFQAAWATGPSVNLFASPTAAQPELALSNPTVENVPLAFLVRREEGDRYLVAVPMRPNGTERWVDKGAVQLAEVPNRIKVEVGARRLTVYKGRSDEVVMATNVAVGKDVTPTPLGNFYVDISVPQNTYTPWILSVAGYSDALQSFGGGIGQIAIHGWSDTSVLGQNVSNGCVRTSFDDLWRLRDLAPVGTPVEIVA